MSEKSQKGQVALIVIPFMFAFACAFAAGATDHSQAWFGLPMELWTLATAVCIVWGAVTVRLRFTFIRTGDLERERKDSREQQARCLKQCQQWQESKAVLQRLEVERVIDKKRHEDERSTANAAYREAITREREEHTLATADLVLNHAQEVTKLLAERDICREVLSLHRKAGLQAARELLDARNELARVGVCRLPNGRLAKRPSSEVPPAPTSEVVEP